MRILAAILGLVLLSGCGTNIREDARTVVDQGGRAVVTNNENRYNARQGCVAANTALALVFDAQALELALEGRDNADKRKEAVEVQNLANAIRKQNHGQLVSARAARAAGDGAEGEVIEPFPPKACNAFDVSNVPVASQPLVD